MKARHKRFGFLIAGMVGLGVATWLVLNALDSNLSYFFSPTEVAQSKAPENHVFRLGGLVETGSLRRGEELTVRFAVTDNANRVNVEYTGILPDLFHQFIATVIGPSELMQLLETELSGPSPKFLNDDLGGPLPIALYSASLFSFTEGRAYSAAEYSGWLSEAGLQPQPIVPTKVHCGVLAGVCG